MMWADFDANVQSAPGRHLASFRVHGIECVIVAVGERTNSGDVLGTFTLCGQCYAVLSEIPAGTEAQDLVDVLTPRELEIAVLVAAGHECKAIARRLRISFHTVRVHLGRIYAKLGLHKQTELAARIASRFPKEPPPLDPSNGWSRGERR
jgi:DNA-binding CsgD family transcriptional regulator